MNLVACLTALALCFVCIRRLRHSLKYVRQAYALWTFHCLLWTVFWTSRTFWPEWTDLPSTHEAGGERPASLTHFAFRYLTNCDSVVLVFAGILLWRALEIEARPLVRRLGFFSLALFLSDHVLFTLAEHIDGRISDIHLGWSSLLAASSVFVVAKGFRVRYGRGAEGLVASSVLYGVLQVPAPFVVFLYRDDPTTQDFFLLALAVLKLPWVALVTYFCGLPPPLQLTDRIDHRLKPERWKRQLAIFSTIGVILVVWTAHLTGIDLTELSSTIVLLRAYVIAAVIVPAVLIYAEIRHS